MLFHSSRHENVKIILGMWLNILWTLFRSFRIAFVSVVSKYCDPEMKRISWPALVTTISCRDSSVGIATRYGLDGPGIESRWGARFSTPVRTSPGAHPAPYTMGIGSFPGGKRPGHDADLPPQSKFRGHERVRLYLYPPSGPLWRVIGRTFTFTFTFISCSRNITCMYSWTQL